MLRPIRPLLRVASRRASALNTEVGAQRCVLPPLSISRHVTARRFASSVDDQEIAKFARAASEWWNPSGEFEMLHRMNPVRVRYVKDLVTSMMHVDPLHDDPAKPFTGLRILDIGCGGGLLSEALARLGAEVVGADAGGDNIAMAKVHALEDPTLAKGLEYRHTTAEQLVLDGEQFDVVCALEIIEHVVDPKEFTRVCSQLVKPNGLIFFSTINRTPLSYLLTIFMAEKVLRWVPPGTHEHSKYISPEEMKQYLTSADCQPIHTKGMGFNPLTKQWRLLEGTGLGDLQMNFITGAQKLDTAISVPPAFAANAVPEDIQSNPPVADVPPLPRVPA
ncbi:hypothetical protein HKX48_008303 [Thoreauomyces humboldtii]|nr:hypothetical protein HKX48_008303 [Thoreauomyces humboldtii]